MRPVVATMIVSVLDNTPAQGADENWWHDCHNMVLGPDQKFYACDKPLTYEIGTVKDQMIGDPKTGMNWDARAQHYAEAIKYVESQGYGKKEAFCPMGVYFYAKEGKLDPAPLLHNFERVSAVFAKGLNDIVDDLKDNPTFKELYVDTAVV